ncbi:MAG: glutathione synthase/RimK-type ligase-like ATP-grasp enzyme [Cyclobacteriaceae bacterium]|jgi:glutathione synthase/RimK-type ligase-like ATP-grasp enzyme
MKTILVTEKISDWKKILPGTECISSTEYLESEEFSKQKRIRVINLCASYQYQQIGYYVSLLAEARGHKVLPTTSSMMDVKLTHLIKGDAQDFDQIIQSSLDKYADNKLEIKIFFGKANDPTLAKLSSLLFQLYQMPVLMARFEKKERWQLSTLRSQNIRDLTKTEQIELLPGLQYLSTGKNAISTSYTRKKYDLAILVNSEEAYPPSDAQAIQKFIKAAEKVGFNTELISKSDFSRITQFDALFIRETTNVNHHTFRIARYADYEGLAVIDDPESILKCTNKIYLNELLQTHEILTPKSVTFAKGSKPEGLAFPYVLKLPDGAFSKGVKKVSNDQELEICLNAFFQQTDLLIAQEFLPTPFDWRVGVLNNQPLYICKYFMASKHWQIVDWRKTNVTRLGKTETFDIKAVPKKLIQTAIKATKLIGNGLYGVDIKEIDGKYFVIEINDNPSIDSGIEDKLEKSKLYETIMNHLMQLVQSK